MSHPSRPPTPGEASGLPPLGQAPKVLLIWPSFPPSFWSFQNMMKMVGSRAVLPPLGLITIAALCPEDWNLRLLDETVEQLTEADLRWADLVLVSAMHVQKDRVREILLRARSLGCRTMIGGPYASSQPDVLADLADHVVVGEADVAFAQIAADLEKGSALRLYMLEAQPSVDQTPVPRYDLLKLPKYGSMALQFSRGCPFECEFCDIITLYGRKTRTKAPRQVLAELETLYDLGWRGEVFVVDDNFVGNRKRAFDLVVELAAWQRERDFPFTFYTEASIDLAQRPELVDAMVDANFAFVFVGIETPSREALSETHKHQNLRTDMLRSLHFLFSRGLWVTGGFIVGFDSDREDIFEQQVRFISEAAIPWAMIGLLQAPPTTPLFDRMLREGRLLLDSQASSNYSLPNFRTKMPLPILLRGFRETLVRLYQPEAYYDRAFRSLWHWKPKSGAKPPHPPVLRKAAIVLRSLWTQGLRSSYRGVYWRFLARLFRFWWNQPAKMWLGYTVLLSGHHFLSYAAEVTSEIDCELRRLEESGEPSALADQDFMYSRRTASLS